MRVGLLECDHVADRFRAISGDYHDMFSTLLALHGPGVSLVPYDVIGGALPETVHECDAWMCTGSAHSVYEPLAWIDGLVDFTRRAYDAGAPFAGICFGHQVLARALGGTVERAPGGWGVGVRTVEVTRAEPWMRPARPVVRLQFMHQDQVTDLPSGAVALGRADHCPVAMFRAGPSAVGLQAHPEFSADYADALLDDRVDQIGPEAVADARRSLRAPTDHAVVTRWLTRFLGRRAREAPR